MDVSYLLVEIFMKVMNGLVMTLEEDKGFLCVWLFCCRLANGGAKISIKPNFTRSFFCFSLFSSSEVLGKISSIRSKLPTAACWSGEEKRVTCEANLL